MGSLADEQVTSLSSAGDVIWPLADNLGSVRQLALYDYVSDTTTIEKYVEYDSFGNVTLVVGSVAHLFGYTGRSFDASTGLQNNLNRWYDATTGLWMSEDPIGFSTGDPNFYRYVGKGPTGNVISNLADMWCSPRCSLSLKWCFQWCQTARRDLQQFSSICSAQAAMASVNWPKLSGASWVTPQRQGEQSGALTRLTLAWKSERPAHKKYTPQDSNLKPSVP